VIGRIEHGMLIFDLRCLTDEAAFVANLAALKSSERTPLPEASL
jgi:hypothetical protein